MQLLELREHRVLAPAVEDQSVVAALADALVLRSGPAMVGSRVEEGAMGLDGSPHRTEPVEIEHAIEVSGGTVAGRGSVRAGMESGPEEMDNAQRRVIGHRRGPLLVTGTRGLGPHGGAGSPLRLAGSEDGVRAERILVACRTRAGAATLRDRVEAVLAHAHEEPWIGTHAEIAERILREHPTEAGLDPFFTTVTAADRLAILLDRVDDLPLRRHEIRGNPAGLLARLLRRIDLLKLECVTPDHLRDWATQRDREAKRPAQRERARREIEFAELYARHDRMVSEAGSLDEGDLLIEAERLTRDRPDIAEELHGRFEHVMVDELEEAAPAHMRLIAGLVVARAGQPRGDARRRRGDPALPGRGRGLARVVPGGVPRGRGGRAARASTGSGPSWGPPWRRSWANEPDRRRRPTARCASGAARASARRPRPPRARSRLACRRARRCPSGSA